MLDKVLLLVVSASCVLLVSEAGKSKPYEKNDDVYQVLKIRNVFGNAQEFENLNNWLIEQTSSADPQENFEILRKNVEVNPAKPGYNSNSNIAKRILMSLSTLDGYNLCTHYGYVILDKNHDAAGKNAKMARGNNEPRRRIDKILMNYINQHVESCGKVYFNKFEEIYRAMDNTMKSRTERFFDKAIENLTSDRYKENQNQDYVERLFNRAKGNLKSDYKAESDYVWRTLREVVEGHPDAKFADKVEDERRGIAALKREKFDRLFDDYLLKPCHYYREQLGPDVFEPANFDSVIHHELKEDKVDFYKAWLTFRLCDFDRTYRNVLERTVDYVNEHDAPDSSKFPGTYYLTEEN